MRFLCLLMLASVFVFQYSISLYSMDGDIQANKEFLVTIAKLQNQGTCLDTATVSGIPILIQAIWLKGEQAVQTLIAAGVSVNAQNIHGTTPLHWAAHYGCHEIMRMLLKAGAAVNKANNEGITALHIAAKFGYEKVIQILIANGADPLQENIQHQMPIHIASLPVQTMIRQYVLSLQCARQRIPMIATTVACSTHKRIGSESPFNLIPQFLLKDIVLLTASAEEADARYLVQAEYLRKKSNKRSHFCCAIL